MEVGIFTFLSGAGFRFLCGGFHNNVGKKRRAAFVSVKWVTVKDQSMETAQLGIVERMKKTAREMGFSEAEVIPVSQLVFVPEYRKYCEENACGNYGSNYACPPYCGTVENMRDRVREYDQALVVRTNYVVKNAMDGNEIKPLKREHNQRTRRLVEKIRGQQVTDRGVAILAGPCDICGVCKICRGEPCPMEQERFSCLSAYCIDVCELSKAAGMEISWDMDKVHLYSVYLFHFR